jgi:hypothetical protein
VAEEGMFKGQNFRFIVLKKVVCIPKSGKLKIEPLTLEIRCAVAHKPSGYVWSNGAY